MQQNPNPQPDDAAHVRTKSRRTRPYTIEAKTLNSVDGTWREWYVYGRYRTERERDDALEKYQRTADLRTAGGRTYKWIEYRVGPDNA